MRVPLSADIDRDNAVPASKGASSEWHSIALESKGLAGEGREVPRNVGRRDAGPDRLTYSVEEAASVVGISRRQVYEEIRQHKLRSKKVGKRRLILRSDLLEWLLTRPSG